MKIVYMGTPEIAKVCLEKLYTEGFDIAAVYTKPDTPKNRGMKLIPSEVKAYAVSVGLPVVQPQTFKDDAVIEQLRAFAPDLMIVVAYGKILPQRVLDIPKYGCINTARKHSAGAARCRSGAVVDSEPLQGNGRDGNVSVRRHGRGRYH